MERGERWKKIMKFDEPISFREAVRQLAAKKIVPTNLTSADLAQINREVMRVSFTSAQTTEAGLLDAYKRGVENIVGPSYEPGADFNPAKLREFIKDYLVKISYQPEEGKAGTIQDLSSDGRINLVIKTNTELAHGAGRFVQQNADDDVVDLWPGLELVRFEDRDKPRDWEERFRIACQVAGDVDGARVLEESGRMAALKSSGVWQALGDGAGGYLDTLGNPYPPFAFQSGMWTEEKDRAEAVELGLIGEGEEARGAEFDLGSLFAEAA